MSTDLRAVGPAHYGPGRYANGTDATGEMNADGLALLKKMEELNIILDATHLCDDAFWQAMDNFQGHVWASHNLCRALVDHNRQFSDDMIKVLIERGAVIGAAFDAWMIVPGWVRKKSMPKEMNCNIEKVIDHIDHICQLAGNTLHVGIGSDLDGGYGREQCPYDLETIADLQTIPSLLHKRGYTDVDIENIMQQKLDKLFKGLEANKTQYGEGLTDVHPPSIIKLCPVICLEAGETRNKAALAISFVVAGFPIGVMRLHVFVYSLSSNVLSVSVAPGAIAFTLIL